MNQLNSVLLEGQISSPPEARKNPETFTFPIISTRYKRGQDSLIQEDSTFTIQVNTDFVESRAQDLQTGRGIRVVGRLHQASVDAAQSTHVVVIAEHIEFKPQFIPCPRTPADKLDMGDIPEVE